MEESLKGKKILVIDDEPDIRDFISTYLKDQGSETFTAGNGEKGLALARKVMPDLITLDITMPGKSGVQVFNELRGDPRTCGIAVCIITGVADFRQLMQHRTVKAPEGFIEKPIKEELLLETIEEILDLHPKRTAE